MPHSKLEAAIAAVVCDMDGTLVMSEKKVHEASWLHALGELVSSVPVNGNSPADNRDYLLRRIWNLASGRPEPQAVATMVTLLKADFGISTTADIVTGLRMTYLKENQVKVSPNPFIVKICRACEQEEIPLGLCTSSRTNISEWLLKAMKIDRYFDRSAIVTCDLVEASGHFKPSPLPWALAFDRLEVFGGDGTIVVLEDNLQAGLGALAAHPRVQVYLLVPEANYQRDHFQVQKVQPPEFGERIQVVTSWKPVLDRIKLQKKYLSPLSR